MAAGRSGRERATGGLKTTRDVAEGAGDKSSGLSQAMKQFEREATRRLRGYRMAPTNLSLHFSARVDGKHDVKLEWHRVLDPDLGTLTFHDGLWRPRPRAVPGFGDEIRVTLEVPNAFERRKSRDRFPPPPRPPSAGQRKAFRSFVNDSLRYRRVIEEANWKFYQENVLGADGEGQATEVTHPRQPSEVWPLLDRLWITIPAQGGRAWWMELTWECRWDPEHGHKVILRNGKPNYVGQQGGG